MKNIVILLLVGVIAWQGYNSNKQHLPQFSLFGNQTIQRTSQPAPPTSYSKLYTDIRPPEYAQKMATSEQKGPSKLTNYRCDGRTYCSQMNSCEEATWFLKNCPGTKMDGNNDGIPCEKQWCK